MHIRGAVIVLGVIGVFAHAAFAQLDRPYLRGLGDLPGGNFGSEARAISGDGRVVVGASCNGLAGLWINQTFVWTADQGMVGLDDLPGPPHFAWITRVSGDGRVIVGDGNCQLPTSIDAEAMVITDGKVEGLGFPNSAHRASYAVDVSRDGLVVLVNSGSFMSGESRVFLWSAQSGIEAIDGRPLGYPGIFGMRISDDGSTIAGYVDSPCCLFNYPFHWSRQDGFTLIEPCGNPTEPSGTGLIISGDGTTVVGLRRADDGHSMFRWNKSTGMVLIQRPGQDYDGGVFGSTPDCSLLVGNTDMATIWSLDGMSRDFKSFAIAHGNTDAANWISLEIVIDIADDGRTVVGGGFNSQARQEAFIAKLNRPGDGNGDGLVDVVDLLNVIQNWGPCGSPPCTADVAPAPLGDDQLNVADLLMVTTNWG